MDPKDKNMPKDDPDTVRSLEDIDVNLRTPRNLDDISEEPEPMAKEDTLDDLAREEVDPPAPIGSEPAGGDEELSEAQKAGFTPQSAPFKTTNVNLDDVAPEPAPRPMPHLDEEEDEGVGDEIHIPNLRSPKLSQNPSFNRQVPDETYQDAGRMREVPFERGSPVFRPTQRKSGASKIHLLILLIIGIAVIGATVYFLKNQFKSTTSPELTQATPTPTAEPTPTPTPELDRSKFVVKVMNGTTKAGLAATVSAKLKELGYQTEKGTNAPNQNYQRTEIKAKEGQEALVKQLIKDLSGDFDATLSGTLKSSSTTDADIILGLK